MKIKVLNIEALIWICGLTYLFFADSGSHYSFCIFKNLGIHFCPGCGLGRSIHYLMHFQVAISFQIHPSGIFALPVLLHRIFSLIIKDFQYKNFLILPKLVRSK